MSCGRFFYHEENTHKKNTGVFFFVLIWGSPTKIVWMNLNDSFWGWCFRTPRNSSVDTVDGRFCGSFLSHYLRQIFNTSQVLNSPNIAEASTVIIKKKSKSTPNDSNIKLQIDLHIQTWPARYQRIAGLLRDSKHLLALMKIATRNY